MKQLLSIFTSFFKIGCFTFGGGYAMIMMMQREVADKQGWVTPKQFLSYLSLAQASPGPMAVNTAILIGYKERGLAGGLCGFLGSVLPSFIILLLIAIFFKSLYTEPVVEAIFKGIRPAVVALILYPVFTFAKNITRWEYPVCIAIAAAIYFGISPIYLILSTIVAGCLYTVYYTHNRSRAQK